MIQDPATEQGPYAPSVDWALRDAETTALRAMARGRPLGDVLEIIVRAAEDALSGTLCSILLLDSENRLRHGAAPGLDPDYNEAIDGLLIGERVGSCGTAAHRRRTVIVEDIPNDPLWADYREMAAQHELAACWSTPILTSDGEEVLGTFAMYSRTPRRPSPSDRAIVERAGQIAQIVIERHRTDERLRSALEREREARAEVESLYRVAESIGSARLDLDVLVQLLTDEATGLVGAAFGAFFYNVIEPETGEAFLLYSLSGAPKEAFEKFGVPRATPLFKPTFDGEGIVRLDDVREDSRYGQWDPHCGMPKGHLPVVSYLAVPVVSATGEVHGGLFFGHPERGRFTETHERMVSAVARQAAVAIDSAQMHRAAIDARAQQERLVKQAESANRAKDEFLAMLGHELRNPLSPILTALQLQKMRGDGSAETGIIERQVGHLVRLVDDLLDVSRITRGKIVLQKRRLEIAEAVGRAVETVSPLLEARNHHLHLDVDPEGLAVEGDPARLTQIVSNLLTNAAKYSEDGSHIWLSARADDGMVRLSVRDEGVGIDEPMLEQIFELFEQQRQTIERAQGGLGLGLAIVRSLAQLHGGQVSAQSPGLGGGSQFVVELPRVEATGSEGTESPPPALRFDPGARRKRILVVDDNEDAAQTLADALRVMGHEVELAHDGPSALERAEAFEPEIALVDIGLPVMDGYEVATRLRERADRLAAISLVAVTGYGQDTDRERSSEVGFNRHLVKPVSLERIREVVEELG